MAQLSAHARARRRRTGRRARAMRVATLARGAARRGAASARARTTYATNEADALSNLLTPRQNLRRAALRARTTGAAGAYVSYFATPIVADGSARSCAALTRSRDGFMARAGAARARAMWALGDVGNARGALLANDALGACVETACRRGMDARAREAASAMLRDACEDARGIEALRRWRTTLETCARERGDGERRGWWWTRTRATSGEDAGDGGGLDATRANVAATLEKLRS